MTLSTARSCAAPLGQLGCSTCSSGAGCGALLRLAASDRNTDAAPALGAIVEAWWPAVFAMARRSGFRAADAEDVTQAYFARFLEKGYVRDAAQWGGCFRPFLYTTVLCHVMQMGGLYLLYRGGFWLTDYEVPTDLPGAVTSNVVAA